MDNLGTEVSNKIRSAIKAKLIELDAYVDDELPDYIMVMVANDRTKDQMEEDLGLFLNENTIAFTTWLHNVLDKLRKVTLDEVAKKDTSEKKKKKKKEPKKKEKDKEKKKKKIKVSKEKDKKIKKVVGKEDKNANTVELGAKKSKPESSEGGEEKEEYDAEAILKKAVKSSVKSLKVNPVKSGTPTKKVKRKKITSLKEDQELFKPNKTKGGSKTRARSRSFSIERRGVASQVQVVRKRRSRSRSPSYEEYRNKRSVASKAILPPRPSRPTGRDDKGVARVLSRSMIDADRSILKSRRHVSPPEAYRKARSPISSRSPVLNRRSREDDRRDVSARRSPDDRSRRFPRLSPEDIERFQMIKEQYKKGEGHRLKENLDKRKKDKAKDEARRLKREVDLLSSRQLAMDRELEKLGRASSLDRELKRKKEDKKRKLKIETVELEEEEDDEIRIIVRRDEEDVEEEEKEEEEEVVERVVVQVEEADEVSPPKKARKSIEEEKEVRKLELEDAELLEMRKKALESLMRKRAEERNVDEMRDRRGKEEVERRTRQEVELRARDEVERRGREEGRKIIIPLNDESTSNSDSSSSYTDSEVSLSEEEGEPTFIVTMDGIDEQYFKYKQKQAEQGGKKKKTNLGEPVVSRHSPDDELQLHPEEQFDSPAQSPGGLKQNIKPGNQTPSVKMIPGIERPKSKPLKQTKPKTESKPVGPVTGSIRESKPEPKPKLASVNKVAPKVVAPKPSAVKPVQASLIGSARQQTKISKQVIKPSVQGAVTTKTTQLTKPVSLQGSTTSKPVSGPATKPLIPASAPVKPVYKKVLAVKPSVANPEKTAITINAKDAGAKPKRTPITAPPVEFPPKKIISLKPVFTPVPFVNPYTSSQGKSGELCIYYPKCIRGNQCFYRHPSPAEAILLKPSAPQQFRWSAR